MDGGASAKGGLASYPPGCRRHGKRERRKVAEVSVDRGTGNDCSDPKGHTASASITLSQRRWRDLLVSAMARQGFVNYSKEWWHFSMPGAGGPAYDFPIKPR